MGRIIKPRFSSDFPLLPENEVFIFRTDNVKVEESEEAEKVFKVESVVEGGEYDGVRIFDNFPLVSKKDFGLERLCGFLVKLGVFEQKDGYDSDIFASQKFQESFKVKVPGKTFGGRVRIKTTDQGNKMNNIVEYYTVKEAMEILSKKDKGKHAKPSEPKVSEPSEEWF